RVRRASVRDHGTAYLFPQRQAWGRTLDARPGATGRRARLLGLAHRRCPYRDVAALQRLATDAGWQLGLQDCAAVFPLLLVDQRPPDEIAEIQGDVTAELTADAV